MGAAAQHAHATRRNAEIRISAQTEWRSTAAACGAWLCSARPRHDQVPAGQRVRIWRPMRPLLSLSVSPSCSSKARRRYSASIALDGAIDAAHKHERGGEADGAQHDESGIPAGGRGRNSAGCSWASGVGGRWRVCECVASGGGVGMWRRARAVAWRTRRSACIRRRRRSGGSQTCRCGQSSRRSSRCRRRGPSRRPRRRIATTSGGPGHASRPRVAGCQVCGAGPGEGGGRRGGEGGRASMASWK